MNERKRWTKKRILLEIAEYGAALIIGIILYKLCRPYAVAWRGSTLYGGEIALLGLPVWYGMVKSVVKDLIYYLKAWREDLPC